MTVQMQAHGLEAAIGPGGFLPGLALALAIGLLIGIERGWQLREQKPGERVAGVRTFALMGLLGGLAGLAMGTVVQPVFLILLAAAGLTFIVGYFLDARADGNVSATSALASMVTLGLGALAGSGQMALASVGSGAAVILLALREELHRALVETTQADIKAIVRLALVVLVILPLLPDAPLGPFGLNPRRLWTVVVLIGSVSFVGYVLIRILGGRRGVLLTALVGALVSSTAVTLESARRIRAGEAVEANEAAIAIASAIMFARTCTLVALLVPGVLGVFLGIAVPALAVAVLAAGLLVWRSFAQDEDLAPAAVRPPDLKLALMFGLLVTVIATASSWAEQQVSGSGAAVIALGGLVDVDSAVAALATLPKGTLEGRYAAYALAAPVVFNTLLKAMLALGIAGAAGAWRAGLVLVASAAAMIAAALVTL